MNDANKKKSRLFLTIFIPIGLVLLIATISLQGCMQSSSDKRLLGEEGFLTAGYWGHALTDIPVSRTAEDGQKLLDAIAIAAVNQVSPNHKVII